MNRIQILSRYNKESLNFNMWEDLILPKDENWHITKTDFFMVFELQKTKENLEKPYYQLFTKEEMTLEETMKFNFECPKCSVFLTPQTLSSDGHKHSWYTCPNCNKGGLK